MASSCSSIDGVTEEMKISVKERTQRFNKMASEVDLPQKNGSSSERRESKSKVCRCFLVSAEFLRLIVIRFQVGDDDDTSSVGTVSQIVRVEEHDLLVVVSFFFFLITI